MNSDVFFYGGYLISMLSFLAGGVFFIAFFLILRYTAFSGIPARYQKKLDAEKKEIERKQISLNYCTEKFNKEKNDFEKTVNSEQFLKLQKDIERAERKLSKMTHDIGRASHLYNALQKYISDFRGIDFMPSEIKRIENLVNMISVDNLLEPTAEVKLRSYDIKELRRQYRDINKEIDSVLLDYERRYTSKGNLAIYRLMVIALRAELQNVLYTMKYDKFEIAQDQIEEITDKYMLIAADGNKAIAPTIAKFIAETRQLFIEAARVEYEYYVRKERAKEEQKALREQMRQEAEEKRRLEEEQRKVELEESKYLAEMEKLHKQLQTADDAKSEIIFARLSELEQLMAKVEEKKEAITKLQNGKAGYIYIISNLGSFGETTFKIGMTRRINPQDRVDELGDASVPFKFDVHSFIFSADAPALETAIHDRLNDCRVNKVNLRKEFFNITMDDLEALVYQLEPSAEFNRTMAAEQYRQSLSINEAFTDYEQIVDDED